MAESIYYFADDVAELLEISKSHAYKVIQQLNNEIKEKYGKITFGGRISKTYFHERFDYVPEKFTPKRAVTKKAKANAS